jgi:hypothetical protein
MTAVPEGSQSHDQVAWGFTADDGHEMRVEIDEQHRPIRCEERGGSC